MSALTRHRGWLLITAVAVTGLAAYLLLGGGQATQSGYLDPDNPSPGGAQAVARVLADHDVQVVVVRSADELEREAPGSDATVVVTSTEFLGINTGPRLRRDAAGARLVLVEPGPGLTTTLGFSAGSQTQVDGRESACNEPAYAKLEVDVPHGIEYPTAAGCFTGDQGHLIAFPEPGVTLLGAGAVLRNDTVTRADNAAVALRTLGQRPRLVWYVPALSDLGSDDGVSLAALLPRWVRPVLWVLIFATLGLLLWRGRRLGALVTEPLPVTVRSIETTRSRGRLYRKVSDRGHAAAALRASARRGCAGHLGIARAESDEQRLLDEVARRVARPQPEIDALLGSTGPVPGSDHDLLALADHLAALEREVRRT